MEENADKMKQNSNGNNVETSSNNGGITIDQIKLQEPAPTNENQESNKKRGSQASHDSNSRRESRRQSKRDKASVVDVFQMEEQEDTSKYPLIKKLLDNNIFNIFITIITMYALFGDDLRVIGFQKKHDIYFDIVTIVCLITFTVEITMSMFAKPGYIFSFFFWLDIMSTLSMILDIQFVANAIFFSGQAASTVNLARAGRASRVGTKAGRVVRLVRLIRIVKLYKASTDLKTQKKKLEQKLKAKRENKKSKKKGLQGVPKPDNKQDLIKQKQEEKKKQMEEEEAQANQKQEEQKESRVSKKLSDLTTKRVIVIVLSLLFVMPLFTADYYFNKPGTVGYQTSVMKFLSEKLVINFIEVSKNYKYLEAYGKDLGTELIKFDTPFGYVSDSLKAEMKQNGINLENYTNKNVDIDNDLRKNEISSSSHELSVTQFCKRTSDDSSMNTLISNLCTELKQKPKKDGDEPNLELSFTAAINIRSVAVFSSLLSLGRTIFVCIVLTMGALLFSKDANDLALRPIERMIEKVNQIARNPNEAKNQEMEEEVKGKEQYETVIIENAITKIGTLLALGFGEAGSEIIGSNMQRVGDVNPLIPGKKKVCIYGFCDIRNFTDATEQLQEEVMLFVNNIGGIVHSMVDRFLGAANKNIGDAFLLVWKIPEDKVDLNDDNHIQYIDEEAVSLYSDFSAISFMKIQAKINREPCILKYRQDERLLERFKDYKVRIGYGLHIGWSIEGAIGSEFKIDASYLSPNVKMSERLEGTTKVYGVPLLISHDLYERFSESMKYYVRKVDSINWKNSKENTWLYTIDMHVEGLEPSKGFPEDKEKKEEKQMEDRLKREEIVKFILKEDKWDAKKCIQQNKDLGLITRNFNPEFQNTYHQAIEFYQQGEWGQAKQQFDEAKKLNPNDGPTNVLLKFMAEYDFKAPAEWPGHREISE